MTAYRVRLRGCDETTTFVIELSDAEAALLRRVAAVSQEISTYSCEPTLSIEPAREEVTA